MIKHGQRIRKRVQRLAVAGVVDDLWSWMVEETDGSVETVNEASILADPEDYAEKVQIFVSSLLHAREDLEASRAILDTHPDKATDTAWRELAERYNTLTLGFLADAESEDPNALPRPVTIGFTPLLVVAVALGAAVVSVSVGAAAIAWAVVGYEYAVNLREQTSLQLADLKARVDAAKGGYKLQDSTLPPPGDDLPWWAWTVPLGLVVVVGGGLLLASGKKAS